MRILLTALFVASASLACTSPYKVHELEDDGFEAKDKSASGTIGISGKDELEIKTETTAAHELQVQEQVNTRYEDQLVNATAELKDCRSNVAGSEPVPSVDLDAIRPKTEAREDTGLDKDGQLKHVRREYFLDRMKAEQAYEKRLKKAIADIQSQRRVCETAQPAH